MIQIKNPSDCCGCFACVQKCPIQCIDMETDHEGFLYPRVDEERCVDCGLCNSVCPVLNSGCPQKPLNTIAANSYDDLIRAQSSSGGVFSLLAERIISDGGVVFGAKVTDAGEVVHACVDHIDALAALRGSKYVESRIGQTFIQAEEYLKKGILVLFSGTPCQISGLKRYLNSDYENLYAVDFVCHGVPSPKVFKKYLKELLGCGSVDVSSENSSIAISTLSFRDKSHGWKKFSFCLEGGGFNNDGTSNEVEITETLHRNLFLKGFLRDLFLRPSCHDCPTKNHKSGADITLADYWGVRRNLPDFDDDKGTSLVMVMGSKGEKLYGALELRSREIEYLEAIRSNPSVLHSAPLTPQREQFFAAWRDRPLLPLLSEMTREPQLQQLKRMAVSIISNCLHRFGIFKIMKRVK